MSNPPPVKTAFSDPDPVAPSVGPTSESTSRAAVSATTAVNPKPAADPPPDPKIAAVVRLLRPVPDAVVHPEAEARLARATRVEVALATHRLRVYHAEEVLIDSPLATGRALSPTPEGEFTLAAKPTPPNSLRYGHFRTQTGSLLVRGVFPKIDSLPADAVFDAVTPKGLMQLSGDGPLIFGGEATGAATTDGSLVLPDRIALLLHQTLAIGLTVKVVR
ncbi:MAG: L,D-transpeptidase [Verrucomicrobiales bacterium]